MSSTAVSPTAAATVREALATRAGALLRFAWTGWAGVAAIALLGAVWQIGHERLGDFVLPSPEATLRAAAAILAEPAHRDVVLLTVRRALEGFAIAAAAGAALGAAAGHSPAALRLARPLLTIVVGVPPIAWIVLAMIWLGSGAATVVATVVVAAMPLAFVGAAEGIAGRDRGLDDMARAFGAGPLRRFATLGARQLAAHLFPALALALGTSFKVAVMAELLANAGGIGSALATARAQLDVAAAMAWVLVSVAALLAAEYGLLHPVRTEFERWRDTLRAWGVRR